MPYAVAGGVHSIPSGCLALRRPSLFPALAGRHRTPEDRSPREKRKAVLVAASTGGDTGRGAAGEKTSGRGGGRVGGGGSPRAAFLGEPWRSSAGPPHTLAHGGAGGDPPPATRPGGKCHGG